MVDIAEHAFDNRGAARGAHKGADEGAGTVPARSGRSPRRDWSAIALPMLAVAAVLAGWEATIRLVGMSPFVLPSPGAVAVALVEIVRDGSLLENLLATLEEAALGFAVAVAAGIVIGGLMAQSPLLERMLYGYL